MISRRTDRYCRGERRLLWNLTLHDIPRINGYRNISNNNHFLPLTVIAKWNTVHVHRQQLFPRQPKRNVEYSAERVEGILHNFGTSDVRMTMSSSITSKRPQNSSNTVSPLSHHFQNHVPSDLDQAVINRTIKANGIIPEGFAGIFRVSNVSTKYNRRTVLISNEEYLNRAARMPVLSNTSTELRNTSTRM